MTYINDLSPYSTDYSVSGENDIQDMTSTILGIGLNQSLLKEIREVDASEVIDTRCCTDAIDVLPLKEVSAIVFDTRASKELQNDVNQLLSATPITTRIVLITQSTNIHDNQNFTGMGVTTLTAPVSGQDLCTYFQ